jgi:hypothetical protein
MTKEIFPTQVFSEFNVARTRTVPGLFFYRNMQATDLLSPPDMGQGDLSPQERRDALNRMVIFQRPLTALVVFLSVVNLEDLIRHFAKALGKIDGIENYITTIEELGIFKLPEYKNGNVPFSPIHFELVNSLYEKHLGVRPIPDIEIDKLKDLSQIRNIIAHNGSLIRDEDVAKFNFYEVTPNRIINPPPEFVRQINSYLYKIGRTFENTIKDYVFSKVIPTLDTNWADNPPKIILDLIEFFNFFGHLPTGDSRVLNESAQSESDRNKNELIRKCIADLIRT